MVFSNDACEEWNNATGSEQEAAKSELDPLFPSTCASVIILRPAFLDLLLFVDPNFFAGRISKSFMAADGKNQALRFGTEEAVA